MVDTVNVAARGFEKAAEFESAFEESLLHLLFTPLMTEKCVRIMLVDFDVFHVECMKTVISKALGYGIILGSLAVKVPQILKLFSSKSGAGIAIAGVTLELLAITFSAVYSFVNGYPFSAWGEGAFLGLQTSLIAMLVLWYEKSPALGAGYLAVYGLSVSVLASPIVPGNVLWFLNCLTIPFVVSGKSIQAVTNYRNGHTGQLSVVTVSLLFAGSLARIFTSAHETGDEMLIIIYIFSSLVNGMILFQIVWYWERTKKFLAKKTEPAKKKE